MTKRQIKELIIFAMMLLLYNVIVFVVPFTKNATFFTAYTFAMLSIFGFGGIYLYAWDHKTTLRNLFLSVPMLKLGWHHMWLQLAITTGFMIKAIFLNVPAWIVIVVCIVILTIYVKKITFLDIARDRIKDIAHKQQVDTFFIRELQIDIESLCERVKDENKALLSKLAEKVKYSDPVSNKHTAEIEEEIKARTTLLKSQIQKGNDDINNEINEIELLLSERNKKAKMSKLDENIYGNK